MTDADLARWEADAMETMAHGPHRTQMLALLAEVRRLRAALEAIVYASDGCQGHRACNHSMVPWQTARALVQEFTAPERDND